MKYRISILMMLFVLGFSSVAQANTGTPLMWVSTFHLLLGNLLIGLFEGWLLIWLFNLSSNKALGLMILANYISAWVGSIFLQGMVAESLPMDLYNISFYFWGLVGLTYLLTLVLEFPFVALTLRKDSNWLRKSIRGSLIVQTVSYIILFGFYAITSVTSLYTQTQVVELSSISLPERVFLYYISDQDGDVYRRRLTDSKETKIYDLNSKGSDDRLLVQSSKIEKGRWDLMARLETENRQRPKLIPIEKSFTSIVAPEERLGYTNPTETEGTWMTFGPVPQLGGAKTSLWKFRAGFWPAEGLTGKQEDSNEQVKVAFETPFVRWAVRDAVHLPTDKVLFQLGENQICVYDPITRRVALVVKGRGPIAVMQEQENFSTTKAVKDAD
jgi:hypothetical protein